MLLLNMKDKKTIALFLISSVLLAAQIVLFFVDVPKVDYKILLLSLNPQFAYQQTIEFPVWLFSLFLNFTAFEPIFILKIVRSVVFVFCLILAFNLVKNLTKLIWLALGFVLLLQIIFIVNSVSFQFLLWFVFFIPALHFFISATETDHYNLHSKRRLIIASVLSGITLLIHPVSYLVCVVMFGSLILTNPMNKKPVTYLSFLILFLFLSPKILWEIQNAAKPDCPYFVYSENDSSTDNLSNHVIIDDRFNQWDELYQERDRSKIYSLLSSFENQKTFRWKYDKNSYHYLTFVFGSADGIKKQIVRNGYDSIALKNSVDDDLFFAINHNKPEILKPLSFLLFWLGQWGIFLVVPVFLFLTSPRKSIFYRDMQYYFVLIIVAALFVFMIKSGVDRPRPLKVYSDLVNVWFTPVINHSFPSGDAQAVFTMITPLFWLRRKWFAVFFAVAVLTAVNRVVTGAHFPFDVFTGALLGMTVAGVSKFWLWDRHEILEDL